MDKRYSRFLMLLLGCLVTILALVSILIQKGVEVVWINRMHNRFLDGFFYIVTSLGNGWVLIPLLIFGLFVKIRLALVAGVSFALIGITCAIIKSITNLPRPAGLLEVNSLYFVPGVIVHQHHSFPSGHTATGFCLTVLLALHLQSKKIVFLLLTIALLIGLSRIYLLQHFLMDVAAGAFLGSGVAIGVWHTIEKFDNPWLNCSLKPSFTKEMIKGQKSEKIPVI